MSKDDRCSNRKTMPVNASWIHDCMKGWNIKAVSLRSIAFQCLVLFDLELSWQCCILKSSQVISCGMVRLVTCVLEIVSDSIIGD